MHKSLVDAIKRFLKMLPKNMRVSISFDGFVYRKGKGAVAARLLVIERTTTTRQTYKEEKEEGRERRVRERIILFSLFLIDQRLYSGNGCKWRCCYRTDKQGQLLLLYGAMMTQTVVATLANW